MIHEVAVLIDSETRGAIQLSAQVRGEPIPQVLGKLISRFDIEKGLPPTRPFDLKTMEPQVVLLEEDRCLMIFKSVQRHGVCGFQRVLRGILEAVFLRGAVV